MKRWIALCLVACACGSSDTPNTGPTGTGTLTGTVGGKSITVKDAVFGIQPLGLTAYGINVVVGDRTGLCNLLLGSSVPGPTTVVGFGILNVTSGGGVLPVTTGASMYYPLHQLTATPPVAPPTTGQWFDAAFAVATQCSGNPGTWASGGTVTVNQVGNATGTNLKVTVNINFGSDSLSGPIEAIYCPGFVSQTPPCGGISLLARPEVTE